MKVVEAFYNYYSQSNYIISRLKNQPQFSIKLALRIWDLNMSPEISVPQFIYHEFMSPTQKWSISASVRVTTNTRQDLDSSSLKGMINPLRCLSCSHTICCPHHLQTMITHWAIWWW